MTTYAFPPPVSSDEVNLPGMTFIWTHCLPAGWDLTGYAAHMCIDGISTSKACTVTVTIGVNTYSQVQCVVANSVTTSWLGGEYPYRVILTAPDTSTGILAYGGILVLAPRQV